MKIKVLFVIENSIYGGGEKSFAGLVNGFGDDFDVYVACGMEFPFCSQIWRAARIFSMDFSNKYNIFNILFLARIIRTCNIGIVHSQGARTDFYSALAARIAGARHISTVAMPVEGFDISPIRKAIYRFFSGLGEKMTDRFIVVSEALRRTLINNGIAPEKVIVVPNGVDVRRFEKSESDQNLILNYGLSGKYVVGCAARLVWQKGLEHLIESMAILRRN